MQVYEDAYRRVIDALDVALTDLSQAVKPPSLVQVLGVTAYRYQEPA